MSWKTKKWYDDTIETELINCMGALQIDRMPTSTELKRIGRNDLHMAIQKSKKYSGWAEHLHLSRKPSETLKGQKYEAVITEKLISFGHKVERMTTKHPFDLLVDNAVKIDVKTGKAYIMHGTSRVHSFGINKKNPSCDIYVVVAIDEQDQIEKTFVIPSHKLRVVSMCIGSDSKYNRFIDRWDYVKQYSNFLGSVI